MYLLVAGLNYRTAPVEIREKFAYTAEGVSEALDVLRSMNSIMECSLVATCNRTEFYCVVDHVHCGQQNVIMYLHEQFAVDRSELKKYLYFYDGEKAVNHLFRVACGLDSMVLGETQILGQVREAYEVALSKRSIGTILKQLLPQAVSLAKRCHTETDIGKNAVSISYAAIELGKKIFGDFTDKKVLVIGAGEMSELTAKHLHCSGVRQIYVVNRTYSKARELAERFDGVAIDWSNITDCLTVVDIVISSTGASGYVLDKDLMKPVMETRRNRPLFMIDIAVPRDLDPCINEIEGVFLYDIDELEGIVEANKKLRLQEALHIETIISEEIGVFVNWLDTLEVIPLIKALKHRTDAIYDKTMESLNNKLPGLTEREQMLIRKHTKSIINQILKNPIMQAKEIAGDHDATEKLAAIAELFGVEEEMQEEAKVMQMNRKRHLAPQRKIRNMLFHSEGCK